MYLFVQMNVCGEELFVGMKYCIMGKWCLQYRRLYQEMGVLNADS